MEARDGGPLKPPHVMGKSTIMEKVHNTTAPSPAHPLSGKGVQRISPSSRIDFATESTGSVEECTGPVHDQSKTTGMDPPRACETVKPKVSVQRVDTNNRSTDQHRNRGRDRSGEEVRRGTNEFTGADRNRRPDRSEARQGMEMFSGTSRYDRFFVVKAVDSTPLSTVNTIKAYEELKKHIGGTPKKVVERRDGGLTIVINDQEQSRRMETLTSLAGVRVETANDTNLNRVQGTIRYENHPGYSSQELLDALKTQEVTEIYQLNKKNEDKTTVPIPVFILTFGTTKLPERINIGWTSCPVRIYIPRPRRCFKCQRFGHGANTCRSERELCAKCGNTVHEGECVAAVCCVNCRGPHPSFVRACPTYKKEQEIIAFKVKNNATYSEARIAINRNYVRDTTTYSQAVTNKVTLPAENTREIYVNPGTELPAIPQPDDPSRTQHNIHQDQSTEADNNNNCLNTNIGDEHAPTATLSEPPDKEKQGRENRNKDNQPKRQRENNTPPTEKPKEKRIPKESSYPIKMNIPSELPKKKYKKSSSSTPGGPL